MLLLLKALQGSSFRLRCPNIALHCVRAFSKKNLYLMVGLLLVGTGLSVIWFTRIPLPWEDSSDSHQRPNLSPSAQSAWFEARERDAAKTFWAKEMLAEACGRAFESLWDSVNETSNKLEVLAGFGFDELVLPQWGSLQRLPHGIELREGAAAGQTLRGSEWQQWVGQFVSEGWQLETLEFRHNRFDTDEKGQPSQSGFYFSAHLTKLIQPQRAMLEGNLVVDWGSQKAGDERSSIKRIDASHLKLKTRAGETLFEPILQENIVPIKNSPFIDPLILYDLDGDGLSEIILVAKNLMYHRGPAGKYEAGLLCSHPIESIMSAVIADFDGDGVADLLCANPRGLFLFKGSRQGAFDEPARLVWSASPSLKNAMALTCGDVDADGALDVFLAQYKVPTLGQVLRPYYYDANDGWPSYLLINDGHGNFVDATERAGLASKRWRRTYSASLADLDVDGHLDLICINDFAGVDLYRNDGHGHFNDVTPQWVAESHAFGMADAVADFNADGRLDLLMIGMPSPTVDRLNHLDLWRPYSPDDRSRRPAMTYGNRLYLAKPNGGFEQTALSDSIARSGWSWGCAAFDFDNDGFPDVYIANGLESKQSVRDYEAEFWLHDIFIGEDVDDVTASTYLLNKFGRTRARGWSYGGYEKNRLYLNVGGEQFSEMGHLAGVALEQDCRNVVADDLDGDGRVDLCLTTFEVWPEVKQTLRVYQNRLEDTGHWIGFRLREEGEGRSPAGARVTVHYNGKTAVREIVAGDSHRSQSASTIHFGLGATDRVEEAEIHWMNGATVTLQKPAVDRYHWIDASENPRK